MIMKSCFGKVFKILVAATIAVMAVTTPASAVVARAAYSDTVGLTEDTYETLMKGTTKYNGKDYSQAPYYYNALYYFLNYADLRAAFGADPAKLLEHYVTFGIKEKRIASYQITRGAKAYSSKNEYIVPSYQKTKTKQDGLTVIPEEIHTNGGMNRRQETEARAVALQLAQYIYEHVNTNGKGTAIEMVAYATGIVRAYCDAGTFTTQGSMYKTAYGVFIAHEYSSAGATRALGLILDYLDEIIHIENPEAPVLRWVHVNANKNDDQWCQIVCDNHEAYADAIASQAGYGKHPNWGGKKQDIQTYYKYANESDVINTRPPYVDGEYKVTSNYPKNSNSMMGQTDSYYDSTTR